MLEVKNVKKSFKDFTIYFSTLMLAVCIFYTFNSVESQKAMSELTSSGECYVDILSNVISYVSVFIAFILGSLILYANNFLVKKRNKELGIYMTLGMSKNKISKILSMLLVCVVTLGTTACEKKSDASSQSKTYKKEISKIVVATGDSSVPSSYVENGKHKGFEVDLWNAISEKTGIEVEFIIGEFSSLFGYLDSGKANTVANLITVTEERKEK